MTRRQYIIAVTSVLFSVILVLSAFYQHYNSSESSDNCDLQDTFAGETRAEVYVNDHNMFVYRGQINCTNANKMEHFVYENANTKRIVIINSGGGEINGAKRLLKNIEKYHLSVLITNNGVCGSSCVFVFIKNNKGIARPDALFNFHGGRTADNRYQGRLDTMREWANEISPNLAKFFHSCAIDPTTTTGGIWLYWSEISSISSGTKLDCNNIIDLYRDRKNEAQRRLQQLHLDDI